MAIAVTHRKFMDKFTIQATLLDAVGATADGEWIDVSGFNSFDISITISITASVQVRISYDVTKPADSTHGLQAGSDSTSSEMVHLSEYSPRWLKCMVSAYTDGTVTAILRGIQL